MSFGDTTETQILQLIFNGTAFPWAAATQFDLHLHTADPTDAGLTTTNEATYGGYAVVTVNRSALALPVTGDSVTNAALLQFPVCSSGSNTITHGSISPNGSTQIIAHGAFASSLPVAVGIQPQFNPGTFTLTLN
jgi:hypothetical protein